MSKPLHMTMVSCSLLYVQYGLSKCMSCQALAVVQYIINTRWPVVCSLPASSSKSRGTSRRRARGRPLPRLRRGDDVGKGTGTVLYVALTISL